MLAVARKRLGVTLQRMTATNLGLDETASRALERDVRKLVRDLGGVFPRTYLAVAAVAPAR